MTYLTNSAGSANRHSIFDTWSILQSSSTALGFCLLNVQSKIFFASLIMCEHIILRSFGLFTPLQCSVPWNLKFVQNIPWVMWNNSLKCL